MIDHALRNRSRNGKSDSHAAPIGGENGSIHANDLARIIEEGAARVTPVDRGVNLNVIHVRPVVDVPAAGRNDPRGGRTAKAKRVADRNDPIAHTGVIRIAEADKRQRRFGFDLKQREISPSINASNDGRKCLSVIEDYLDFISTLNDMVVGDDQSTFIHNESGTQ